MYLPPKAITGGYAILHEHQEILGSGERFLDQTKRIQSDLQKTMEKSEFCHARSEIWKTDSDNADPVGFIF